MGIAGIDHVKELLVAGYFNIRYRFAVRPADRKVGVRGNAVGLRAYTRIYPWPYFYLHLEYLYLNAPFNSFSARGNFHNFVFGGGFNIPLNDNLYLITQITANMVEDLLYFQRRPFYTVGLGVRL